MNDPTHDQMANDSFTTYRMADGSLIYGEFTFVTESEFFDGIDIPTEVVKETWSLVSRETVTFTPYGWSEEDDDDPDITGIPS